MHHPHSPRYNTNKACEALSHWEDEKKTLCGRKSMEISLSRDHGAKINEHKSLNSTEYNRTVRKMCSARGIVTSPGVGRHRQSGARSPTVLTACASFARMCRCAVEKGLLVVREPRAHSSLASGPSKSYRTLLVHTLRRIIGDLKAGLATRSL